MKCSSKVAFVCITSYLKWQIKMLDVLRHKTTLVCCYDKPSSNETFYAANEAGAKMVNYFERWMLEGSWHYYKSIDLFQFMNDWVKELYFNL